jgi:hypothetical protein
MTPIQDLMQWMESNEFKVNNPFIVKINECLEDERGNMVKLLRWILKNYSTGTDIEGMFMWENSIGEEFDSIQLVDKYIKENL